MIRRSDRDFDTVYSSEETSGAGDRLDHRLNDRLNDRLEEGVVAGSSQHGERRVAVRVGSRDELVAAQRAAEEARIAHEAAEDALVDAEGLIAVLETKVEELDADAATAAWQRVEAREELARARRAAARAGRWFLHTEERTAAAEDAVQRAEATQQPFPRGGDGSEPVLRFASLPVFVEDFVLPNWVHRLGENYAGSWCTRWWEHAEAVTRLEAIWEAFEVMRLQPAPSFSTWLRDHFDPHLRALTASDGAFHRCEAGEHKQVHELKPKWATDPPPEGMFPVEANAMIQPMGGQGVGGNDG